MRKAVDILLQEVTMNRILILSLARFSSFAYAESRSIEHGIHVSGAARGRKASRTGSCNIDYQQPPSRADSGLIQV